MSQPTPEQILNTPMDANDTDAATVRAYLIELLATLWREEANFSGKRPFGSSGWQWDVYRALVKAGHMRGVFDEDGDLDAEPKEGDALIASAIRALGGDDA